MGCGSSSRQKNEAQPHPNREQKEEDREEWKPEEEDISNRLHDLTVKDLKNYLLKYVPAEKVNACLEKSDLINLIPIHSKDHEENIFDSKRSTTVGEDTTYDSRPSISTYSDKEEKRKSSKKSKLIEESDLCAGIAEEDVELHFVGAKTITKAHVWEECDRQWRKFQNDFNEMWNELVPRFSSCAATDGKKIDTVMNLTNILADADPTPMVLELRSHAYVCARVEEHAWLWSAAKKACASTANPMDQEIEFRMWVETLRDGENKIAAELLHLLDDSDTNVFKVSDLGSMELPAMRHATTFSRQGVRKYDRPSITTEDDPTSLKRCDNFSPMGVRIFDPTTVLEEEDTSPALLKRSTYFSTTGIAQYESTGSIDSDDAIPDDEEPMLAPRGLKKVEPQYARTLTTPLARKADNQPTSLVTLEQMRTVEDEKKPEKKQSLKEDMNDNKKEKKNVYTHNKKEKEQEIVYTRIKKEKEKESKQSTKNKKQKKESKNDGSESMNIQHARGDKENVSKQKTPPVSKTENTITENYVPTSENIVIGQSPSSPSSSKTPQGGKKFSLPTPKGLKNINLFLWNVEEKKEDDVKNQDNAEKDSKKKKTGVFFSKFQDYDQQFRQREEDSFWNDRRKYQEELKASGRKDPTEEFFEKEKSEFFERERKRIEKMQKKAEEKRKKEKEKAARAKAKQEKERAEAQQRRDSQSNVSDEKEEFMHPHKMNSRERNLLMLGFEPNAIPTPHQVKKAYHKLALQWHPDRPHNQDNQDFAKTKFQEISDAYHYFV